MFNAGIIEAAATLDDSQYKQKLQGMPGMAQKMLGKFAGLAAGYLSFKAGVGAIKACTSAFMVQEDAVDNLEDALRLKGAEGYSAELQQLASDLQKTTTYGDELTMGVMAQGLNMGLAADKIGDATQAAMGLAAAYNIDLNTAMQLVAKANAGQTGTLSRYGIVLDQTKSKQEQFAELLKKGKDFMPLAEADTLSAKLTQLQNAWGDLTEVVGQFIVELFGVGDASGGAMEIITACTAYLQQNMDEWVFCIRSVYYEVEAGVKAVWAIFEPAVTFLWQCFKAGMTNIINICKWGFENAGKIWENLPSIFVGIGKDILQYWKNVFTGLLNLAKKLGKAIWRAIEGDGLDGFKDMFNQLCQDAVKTISDSGKYTEEALSRAGVSALPEMQSGDFSGMVDKYKNIGSKFDAIDRERREKQQRLEFNYARKLEEKARGKKGRGTGAAAAAGGPEAAAAKTDVAGSFSAAVLSAMLGAGSPEKETAKNTKEMVRLQRQQLEKQVTADAYL